MMPRPSADMETMGRHYLSGVLHRNPLGTHSEHQPGVLTVGQMTG